MRIFQSARRHGVSDEDILHALRQQRFADEVTEDRWLILGPDRAGNILELIVLTPADEEPVVIHAMKATKENLKYL
ncbi:MAG TPA: hypothetical protein VGH66_02890 [Acidimicrobiales bacterium]